MSDMENLPTIARNLSAMSSFSSSLNNAMFHQTLIPERSPAITCCYFHKPIFKVVAQSSQPVKKLGDSRQQQTNPSNIETKKKTNENAFASVVSFVSTLIPTSNMLSNHFNKMASLVNPPLHPSVDPEFVLTGNFAPVNEMPPTECLTVEGELPASLSGAYIRNGPNPQYQPIGPHHLFEGDGMLHSIRLSAGRATFCSRYVKTYKYSLEHNAGVPVIPNYFSGFYGIIDLVRGAIITPAKAISGHISLAKGFGLANTSLAFFFDRLFALVETDLPYAMRLTKEGDIETIGRHDFGDKIFANMTAHPKTDTDTGDVFAFRCFPVFPHLIFFRFDDKGSKQQDVPIFSMKSPTYVHDFAITKRYAIFPDTQLEMDPMKMVICNGMPARSRLAKMPRIGIIPRYATSDSEMRWFEVPGFNAFHITNAWEDEHDCIIIIAPNVLFIENFFNNMDKLHFSVEKLRIDMKTGMVSRTVLSNRNLELGSINPAYAGKQNRFVYMSIGERVPKMSGVVKIDLELECEVSCRAYGPGCFGGEAFFVSKDGNDPNCDEDDGYVVSYVHNEITNESQFVVMDAKSPTLDIVAVVKLPGRVPYGFHGLFLNEKDLKKL
ncbi:hypothetical protein F0562_013678 [Nyssa sinensis]|uniref:9-cis-epoxycarotenoid dioxygenase n=1 Tax=Nyssa sinensis TaxID=561372 RepID=A0A5J4ZQM0_9ASTE|nr:hypothetical protein F0562_013678 [Nyssa sinensis]